ncbi:MAG: phage holin family protein [Oscillospiraceae bacterium]
MEKVWNLKIAVFSVCGAAGSVFAHLFGGWTSDFATLLIFMGIDFTTGIAVAGIFKKSAKTKNGALESNAGFKGICRKCMMLLYVLIANRLDLALGTAYIRTAVIVAFILNELLSITENAGLMGVPLPPVLKKAIEVLKDKKDT